MQVEGIRYVRAFYTGMSMVRPNAILRYEVKDPPSYGEQGVLVLEPNDQGRRKKTEMLTLFCPFTLSSHLVSREAGEINVIASVRKETVIEGMKEPKVEVVQKAVPRSLDPLDDARIERLSRIITDNWRMRCKLGMPFDLDVATLVLTRLGSRVPEERPAVKLDAAGEVRKSGKPAGDQLTKAVAPDSKPGRVLWFFMEKRRSITEGMAEFGSTRSALQSTLYGLWKNCGLGYTLAADMVDIVLPAGCEDPFTMPAKGGKEKQVAEEKKGRGKPMQDELLITALPEKGKRREVALMTYKGFVEIADVAKKLECSEGSVKSHLNDLHIKHGYGFEIEGTKARLLVPKGWKP